MIGDSGSAPAFDLRAVGAGILWGLAMLVLGGILNGLIGFSSPFSLTTEALLPMVWQAASCLIGGFRAARRAAGSGWLHGVLAGIALILSVAAVMGVRDALPTLAIVLKMAGIGGGAGLLGGVLGVNLAGK